MVVFAALVSFVMRVMLTETAGYSVIMTVMKSISRIVINGTFFGKDKLW